jgi:hypothetical protein
MQYIDHVAAVAANAIKTLKEEISEASADDDIAPLLFNPRTDSIQYDPFDDDEFIDDVVRGEALQYAKGNGWLGVVQNRYNVDQEDITFATSQMIAGASPSIELSFEGQYRKDMFRDVAWNAFLNDIILEIKKSHPGVADPE